MNGYYIAGSKNYWQPANYDVGYGHENSMLQLGYDFGQRNIT
jgi:hypothetical protein